MCFLLEKVFRCHSCFENFGYYVLYEECEEVKQLGSDAAWLSCEARGPDSRVARQGTCSDCVTKAGKTLPCSKKGAIDRSKSEPAAARQEKIVLK
jgi:hypothetical protein